MSINDEILRKALGCQGGLDDASIEELEEELSNEGYDDTVENDSSYDGDSWQTNDIEEDEFYWTH